jgi:hypothetical protein
VNDQLISKANHFAIEKINSVKPFLVNVGKISKLVPTYPKNLILTSGAPLPWEEYEGGQREAILGAILFEGLAKEKKEAESKIIDKEILIAPCHDYGFIGSVTGVYSYSMPIFEIRNNVNGRSAYCSLFEGLIKEKITYGLYTVKTAENLEFLNETVVPVLQKSIQHTSGIDLTEIIRKAINMGDELHSRNSAASLLFTRSIYRSLLEQYPSNPNGVMETLDYLGNDYVFLRLGMAYCKLLADEIANIEHCTLVTAMSFSCKEFSIRVSGSGNRWFRSQLPKGQVKLFEGYSESDVAWMGGESCITETMGLGGFCQATALTLQDYSGGTPETMIENNTKMYEITIAEHPIFKIPYFRFKGTPLGIDIRKVVSRRITPVINMGVAHKDGGQIGAGVVNAPMECFIEAFNAFNKASK